MLVSTSANAAYAEPGYLLYLRDKTLVAQPFDGRRYVLSGEPHTLSDEVALYPSREQGSFQRLPEAERFWSPKRVKAAALSQLTWFDRKRKTGGHDRGARVLRQRTSLARRTQGRRKRLSQTNPDGTKC